MKGMVDLGMPLDKPPLPSPPGYRRKRSGIVPKALPEFATWFPDMSNRFPRRQPGEDEKPESDKHWGEVSTATSQQATCLTLPPIAHCPVRVHAGC